MKVTLRRKEWWLRDQMRLNFAICYWHVECATALSIREPFLLFGGLGGVVSVLNAGVFESFPFLRRWNDAPLQK